MKHGIYSKEYLRLFSMNNFEFAEIKWRMYTCVDNIIFMKTGKPARIAVVEQWVEALGHSLEKEISG